MSTRCICDGECCVVGRGIGKRYSPERFTVPFFPLLWFHSLWLHIGLRDIIRDLLFTPQRVKINAPLAPNAPASCASCRRITIETSSSGLTSSLSKAA
ncbi:MAG TPA: hypothetical protein VKR06_41795 [Ktedonosporobacter sp.]|nr:hypothetical protein [Ktedonosporobacter sp.]